MNDWANYFAIVPFARAVGHANGGMSAEGVGISSGAASGLPPLGYSRKLLLFILSGSLFLTVGWNPARAAEESGQPAAEITPIQQQLHFGLGLSPQPATAVLYPPFCGSGVQPGSILLPLPAVAQSTSPIYHPINLTNGAILAHQVTASSKPIPTARRGVATMSPLATLLRLDTIDSQRVAESLKPFRLLRSDFRLLSNARPLASPLFEGLNIKDLQICTKGYPAFSGIPNPLDFGRSGVEGGNRKSEIGKAGVVRPFRALFRLPTSHFRLKLVARPKSSNPVFSQSAQVGGHPLRRLFCQEANFMANPQSQVKTTINDHSIRNL
ncbi:MAG: hypothetical protein J5I94_13780 [Phaeodactylibacter sp.]|nr:hypothetical protein [Phaeodactylibacter sp.]